MPLQEIKRKLLAASEFLSLAGSLENGAYSAIFSQVARDLVEIQDELEAIEMYKQKGGE